VLSSACSGTLVYSIASDVPRISKSFRGSPGARAPNLISTCRKSHHDPALGNWFYNGDLKIETNSTFYFSLADTKSEQSSSHDRKLTVTFLPAHVLAYIPNQDLR
jgi:hypothetical protein